MDRRGFLKIAGASGVLAGIAAAGVKATAQDNTTPTPAPSGPTADQMDADHAAGVKAFVDAIGKDTTFWGVPMKFEVDGDTKVFKLTCTEGPWEVAPGQPVNAMLYNGRVPGEYIRVTEGDNVRIIV
ncbi:MAG TPA: twin-arginine translocation signal domain-containing protein, partial [Aggregatilineales bacterium]|nr:twin-arginine translocation signal domain-containing protein [Aggregatilineales bacterium]